MNPNLLQSVLLRVAALLVPSGQRNQWLQEWHSEVWYMDRTVALRACLGSFRDALWLRRNTSAPGRSMIHSPSNCLILLFTVSIVGLFAAMWLTGPLAVRTTSWKLSMRDVLPACLLTLVPSLVFLPFAGPGGPRMCHFPKGGRIWRVLFLAAKLIAVQPLLVCGMFINIIAAPIVPVAPIGILGGGYLILRWVIADQQNRCPECLRLLDGPIRIGTRSSTLLEWHGAESACVRGHGLLLVPEPGVSSLSKGRWVALDSSWKSLFHTSARGSQL